VRLSITLVDVSRVDLLFFVRLENEMLRRSKEVRGYLQRWYSSKKDFLITFQTLEGHQQARKSQLKVVCVMDFIMTR
jgi:hypothetical protein